MKKKPAKIRSKKDAKRNHAMTYGRRIDLVEESLNRTFRVARNRRGIVPIAAVVLVAMALWLCGYMTSQKALKDDKKSGFELAGR